VHREPNRHRQSHNRSNGDSYDSRRDDHAEDSDSRRPRAQREDRSSARSPPPSSSKPPPGRASPKYDDYSRRDSTPLPLPHDDRSRRPDTPPENEPPSRQQENMYKRDGRFDGGGDYFERYVALGVGLSELLMFFFSDAGNSVSITHSTSGHYLLVPLLVTCMYFLLSLCVL
jgi:hypothetical protein